MPTHRFSLRRKPERSLCHEFFLETKVSAVKIVQILVSTRSQSHSPTSRRQEVPGIAAFAHLQLPGVAGAYWGESRLGSVNARCVSRPIFGIFCLEMEYISSERSFKFTQFRREVAQVAQLALKPSLVSIWFFAIWALMHPINQRHRMRTEVRLNHRR